MTITLDSHAPAQALYDHSTMKFEIRTSYDIAVHEDWKADRGVRFRSPDIESYASGTHHKSRTGDGYGYGDGNGWGHGYGDKRGDGTGSEDGRGYGDQYGDGWGDGFAFGGGNGNGDGSTLPFIG